MLLSNQQKYIISVLRQIKYIRSCQLCALTAQHYLPQGIEISQHRMDVMLRQLRAGTNFVRLQEDIVCYGKRAVDPRYLEAIDVMLELSGCDPSFLSSERLESPFLLRFTGSGEELSYLFTVAWMDTSERRGGRVPARECRRAFPQDRARTLCRGKGMPRPPAAECLCPVSGRPHFFVGWTPHGL